ncbi:MAG: hypothetical protein JKY42_05440 [Flavobacteriales bacterium]|nr:hypothetical protein [Flavobacteriales bacterium]
MRENLSRKEQDPISRGGLFAIAWPETTVQREGKWYDVPMKWVGLIKNDHYPAGHSALFLINYETGKVDYFDFGRYIAPYHHGRVRDRITDPELEVTTKAKIGANNTIVNIHEILLELSINKGTHGYGRMIVGEYADINYDKAYNKVKSMQNEGSIIYGPLKIGGTNCSRFVAQVADEIAEDFPIKLLLTFPYTVSPTPLFNVRVLSNRGYYYEVNDGECYKVQHDFLRSFRRPSKPHEVIFQD